MTQLETDVRFIGGLIPQHYEIKEDTHKGSIRCISEIGMGDGAWERFKDSCRNFFGERLSEFYHEVNYAHKDFVVYLNNPSNQK